MPTPIQTLHSYRAQLIPAHISADDVETAAERRLLPEVRVKGPSSTWAGKAAAHLMGLPVHNVQRVEEAAAA